MYLWCSKCYHAHPRINWKAVQAKYGVCPSCGSSEYRNAVEWQTIAKVNGYDDEPDPRQIYPPFPVLF